MGNLAFLQVIFPTQGSNPGVPHCRQILYQLSYQGSPNILQRMNSDKNEKYEYKEYKNKQKE